MRKENTFLCIVLRTVGQPYYAKQLLLSLKLLAKSFLFVFERGIIFFAHCVGLPYPANSAEARTNSSSCMNRFKPSVLNKGWETQCAHGAYDLDFCYIDIFS